MGSSLLDRESSTLLLMVYASRIRAYKSLGLTSHPLFLILLANIPLVPARWDLIRYSIDIN